MTSGNGFGLDFVLIALLAWGSAMACRMLWGALDEPRALISRWRKGADLTSDDIEADDQVLLRALRWVLGVSVVLMGGTLGYVTMFLARTRPNLFQ